MKDCRVVFSFYILNSNLNPTPEDYRAAFLINADVIGQTAPQFIPELRLFSGQILQLGDKVREYLLGIIFNRSVTVTFYLCTGMIFLSFLLGKM